MARGYKVGCIAWICMSRCPVHNITLPYINLQRPPIYFSHVPRRYAPRYVSTSPCYPSSVSFLLQSSCLHAYLHNVNFRHVDIVSTYHRPLLRAIYFMPVFLPAIGKETQVWTTLRSEAKSFLIDRTLTNDWQRPMGRERIYYTIKHEL